MREYFDRRGRNGSYTPFVGGEMLLVYMRMRCDAAVIAHWHDQLAKLVHLAVLAGTCAPACT